MYKEDGSYLNTWFCGGQEFLSGSNAGSGTVCWRDDAFFTRLASNPHNVRSTNEGGPSEGSSEPYIVLPENPIPGGTTGSLSLNGVLVPCLVESLSERTLNCTGN